MLSPRRRLERLCHHTAYACAAITDTPSNHVQGPDRDGGEFLPAVTEGEPSGQSPEASADRSFISVRASSGMPYLHQLRASLVFKCRSIPVSLQG